MFFPPNLDNSSDSRHKKQNAFNKNPDLTCQQLETKQSEVAYPICALHTDLNLSDLVNLCVFQGSKGDPGLSPGQAPPGGKVKKSVSGLS